MKHRDEMKFRISDDLVLGADFVVATDGVFATKGLGKTHLAQVMAEEMLSQGQVIVAIDPTDAWWGLRSSADGKSEGYPVVVLGGDHGDLPLEPGGAAELAEAVVAERFSCVICTDGMSDMAETKFVREFLDTVYRKNREPIHIFVDEADVFAPQKPFDVEDARCIRAMSHIVRRGRKKGIGSTLITQRPAELNASVRTMVDMLFVLGMSHNLDIDAVEKWLRLRKKKRGNNAAFALQEEMIESLDSLQRGDAWVWAPRMKIHQRFRARAKRTFDSGATPKPGQKVKAPKKLAPVDLQRLGQAMAAAVQRQKENDPTELKRQVKALEGQLADLRRRPEGNAKGNAKAENAELEQALRAENAELRVKITELSARLSPLFKKADLDRLEKIVARAEAAFGKHDQAVSRQYQAYAAVLENYVTSSKAAASATTVAFDDLRAVIQKAASAGEAIQKVSAAAIQKTAVTSPTVMPAVTPVPKKIAVTSATDGFFWTCKVDGHMFGGAKTCERCGARNESLSSPCEAAAPTNDASNGETKIAGLSKPESAMLVALAQRPKGLTRKQVRAVTGYADSGPTSVAFAKIIAAGYVELDGGLLVITAAGRTIVGDAAQRVPKLSTPERALLTAIAQHPASSRKQIRLITGYADSGPTSTAIGRLVTMAWVHDDNGRLSITEEGLEVLGDFEPLPTGSALREALLSGDRLSKPERRMLAIVCEIYPETITRKDLRERARYADSGPTSTAIGRLVKLNYTVDCGKAGLRAAEELFG